MVFQVALRAPAEREAIIKDAVAASTQTRDFYEFRSQKTPLPLIRIPQDVLLYRMENFRTFIGQKEFVLKEKKPHDYFITGQENESVQQLQHEILSKLARKGVADSVAPLIDVLRANKQREPLLISSKGIVVNGNRRLSAMRELLAEKKSSPEFANIDCIVLPNDATADEIVDIEAALQATPQTLLDYDWIGDCLLIQRLLSVHKTVEAVAARLKRKPAEIQNSLTALAEADLYLKDWAKAEGEYSRVVEAEQLFKDLPDQLEKKAPALAEASRFIAWNLFDNKTELKDRLYAFNVTFGKRAADVMDRVASTLSVPLSEHSSDALDDDSFEVDVESDSSTVSYKPVMQVFKDPIRKEEAIATLIEVCRSVVESERGAKEGSAALKNLTQIVTRLRDVEVGAADPTTYVAIEKRLQEIASRTAGLQKVLSKLLGQQNDN